MAFLGLRPSSNFRTCEGVTKEKFNLVLDFLKNFNQSKAVRTGVLILLAKFSPIDTTNASKVFDISEGILISCPSTSKLGIPLDLEFGNSLLILRR